MKKLAILFALGASAFACAQKTGPVPKTIFVIGNDDVTATGVVKDIRKQCPQTLTVATDPKAAEYILRAGWRTSTLEHAGGGVLYQSLAIHTDHIVKDVCTFAASLK